LGKGLTNEKLAVNGFVGNLVGNSTGPYPPIYRLPELLHRGRFHLIDGPADVAPGRAHIEVPRMPATTVSDRI